jgi:hypothetical protein
MSSTRITEERAIVWCSAIFDGRLAAEHAPYLAVLREAVGAVVTGGQHILGPEFEAFEREFAHYLGTGHALGCNSGTNALVLSQGDRDRVAGRRPDHSLHILRPPPKRSGRLAPIPVFADICKTTPSLDVEDAATLLSPRTRAILPVHPFGQPADIDPPPRSGAEGGRSALGGLLVLAQQAAERAGRWGMVTTDDDDVAERVRMLGQLTSRVRKRGARVQLPPRRDPGRRPASEAAPLRRRRLDIPRL